jgi:uncharacterized RDD family membrane protein YckC
VEITNNIPLSSSSNFEIAGKKFWTRAIAFLLDMIISALTNNAVAMLLGVILAAFLIFAKSFLRQNWSYVSNDSQLLTWLLFAIQTTLYFVVFEWLYGRTLGKIILKMRVISNDGSLCNFKQAITRSLYRFVDGLFFGVIAYLNMKPPLYQRLGDKIAGTLVVNSNAPVIKEFPRRQDFVWATLVYMVLSFFAQVVFIIGSFHTV